MLKRYGIEDRIQLFSIIAIATLIAITPFGREATSGLVLVIYRLLLIGIVLGSLYELRSKEEPEISAGFLGLCAVVALLMLASVVFSPGASFDGLYRWYQLILFGAAFLSMAMVNRQRSVNWKKTLLWTVIAIDVAYLVATLLNSRRPVIGPFANPNYFASFLVVGFCASMAFALLESNRTHRTLAAALAIFLFYGMTQAWSRGATVAAVAAAALAVIRIAGRHGLSKKLAAIVLVIAAVAGAAASPTLLRKFADRGEVDPYNYQRPRIWLAALQVIAEHPVLGIGLGEFHDVSKRFSPAVEGTVARYLKRPGIAHSEYLQQAAETGIPAALLLFGLAGYVVYIAVQRARKCSPGEAVLQEAAILTAAGLGVHALVDNNWSVPIMAAGLAVFSLGDVLPVSEWRFPFEWTPRTKMAFAIALTFVVVQGILIPGIAAYCNEMGHHAYNRHDLDKAESMYRIAAAIAPGGSVFLDNAGVVYVDKFIETHESRWLDFAQSLFVQAMAANPNSAEPGLHLEKALIQRLTGNPQRDRQVHAQIAAVDRQVLSLDPVNPFVRKNLAEALYNSGDKAAAIQELSRAIDYEPNYVPAYVRMSDWYREAGQPEKSAEYEQRAIAVTLKYRDDKTTDAYESLLLGRPLASPAR